MRQIKFRAWHTELKIMAEVAKLHWFKDAFCADIRGVPELGNENFILMQFTGLHDKNGKEIWEGDLVRWNWKGNKYPPMEVKMGTLYEGDDKTRTGWIAFDSFVDENCEVLGNVWENPELVKS